MGGRGSGRCSSYDSKPETSDSMPLDIRKITRKGLWAQGNRFSWQWLVNANARPAGRANKLRKQLGWEAGILNGNGSRPKGMHWKTYQRLKAEHDRLVQISYHSIGRKLGFLHKLLDA